MSWPTHPKEDGQMVWTVLVTALALLMFVVLGALVSRARGMFGVPAPTTSGDPRFERIYRVHQNTGEQLIVFLPSLWMFAVYVSDLWAGLLGLVFIGGRVLYASSYFVDASKRAPGFMISIAATLVLLIGAVIGVLFLR
jgi:glutathione S-transferase